MKTKKNGKVQSVFACVLFLLLLFVLLNHVASYEEPAEAATTITTATELASALRGGSGDYILGGNITWSCGRNENSTFSGTLNGNGYTITLNTGYTSRITTGDNVSIGLMVGNLNGTIKNCTIILVDNPYLYEYTGSSTNYTNYCGIVTGTIQASGRIMPKIPVLVRAAVMELYLAVLPAAAIVGHRFLIHR